MYSETIERLIQSVIADGEITEKERAVLHKKAEAEGIDIDELDVYVDGLIVQQRSAASKATAPAQSTGPAKQGVVTKCPNCGAVIEAGAVKCAECGYVFRGVEANSSAQKLADILTKIEDKYSNKQTWFFGLPPVSYDSEKVNAVRSFPVPTTKEDLFEFIISMKSKYENTYGPLQQAFKGKYEECLLKAKLLFPEDPLFKPLFEKKRKFGCLGVIIFAVTTIGGGLMF
jgi:hypothetical protein